MKLVIDIPEKFYENLKTLYTGITGGFVLSEIVAHGTPLPKRHGRLIDADALRKSFQESIDECHKWAENVKESEMYARVSQALGTFVECSLRTKNAPTIIEADKE